MNKNNRPSVCRNLRYVLVFWALSFDLFYKVSGYNGSDFYRDGFNYFNETSCAESLKNLLNTTVVLDVCCLQQTCRRIPMLIDVQTRQEVLEICKEKVYQEMVFKYTRCTPLNVSLQVPIDNGTTTEQELESISINLYSMRREGGNLTELVAETTVISISLEQLKVKEPTNDNLTQRTTLNSGLQFLDIPKGDDLKIIELQLENGFLLFEAFSSLMGYLLPREFPIDVFREAFKNPKSFHIWLFQVIKLEIIVVVWIIVWAIFSLCLPVGVMASFCFPTNIRRLNEEFPNESLNGRWTENTLGCLLHVLLILMLWPVILILASNEQISRSISKAPISASVIYDDINTFIRNSHMQISFVTTSSTDITIEAIRRELEDTDIHLGVPYQQQLSSETGLDLALLALEEIKEKTSTVASIVSDLLTDCDSIIKVSKGLHDELQEMARQLVVIQQQCNAKDRPLCFTVQFSGFDITLPLNEIINDAKIQQLNRMNKETSFNASIEMARKTYSAIPDQIVQESISYISDIKSLLSRKRTEVYKYTHDLDILARTLSQEVSANQEAIFPVLENVVKWDLWRWLAILATAAIVALIWGLLICGAPCGCGITSKTISLLISGISLSCLICIVVWALGTVSFLLGSHGQSLLCQPLYDHPHYEILSAFLDSGGILYGQKGFFDEFSNENDSVTVANVLKGCQRDQPVYHTFHLKNRIDLEKNLNHKKWEDLYTLFDNFATAKSRVEILSTGLQLNLQILSSDTAANFTTYRHQMSSSITRRDIGSFADQLNTVGRQLADPVISRKLDNLAFSVRKVVQNEMQRLSDLRGRILYRITTLEVLLPPLNRQVNQSLSHLKTIQFFLDNQGWQISERARRHFIARLESYLEDLYHYATKKVTKEIGNCRSLWEMFHVTRFHVCKLVFDPLNAIAFASYFLILVFIITTPVVVKLIDFYRGTQDDLFSSLAHRDSRQGLILDEEQVWTSPSTESPEEREMTANIPTTWVSPPPRPPTVSSEVPLARIPQPLAISRSRSPPARSRGKLSTLARITGGRNLAQQIPTVSRSRTPRRGHESLRLIEPIHWKSGSTTPRSWI